ncbi:MAG: hypothetical protein K6G33_03815 [Ruminococcus sp.]|uniref:hypothetical protein n=1 Tax=Ruminococcus sp. TaxID=41978 RepID=UPI0025E9E17F|nr:hypothetical protein [Ruminococcus sp.]MCR5599858.1 hypothetical protein [Ruminococcus sp.]
MTMQSRDYFYFKGQKFTLIDVEKGKQIIDFGRFNIPKIKQGYCSSCWRGYTAVYSVEKKQLWGIKYNRESGDIEDVSRKTPVFFTGSCIIALDNNRDLKNSDQLADFLSFEYAFELHFTRGILTEINDISKAIQEAKELENDNRDEYFKERELLARKYLKYNYDEHKTYKWRYPAAVKWEKEFIRFWESRRKKNE